LYDHVDVYLDESGDLGSSSGSSRYIVVAALATDESHEFRRLVRASRKRFRSETGGAIEFKFNRSSAKLRMRFLEDIARTHSWIAWCGFEKSRMLPALKPERERLLHVISGSVVSEIARRTHARSMNVIVDKRWTKERQRNDFSRYVEKMVSFHHSGYFAPALEISHFDSMACEGLQVVDFVAGAVFKSVERADGSYLGVIGRNILHGELW
jgi:hypothetical protein